MMEKFDLSDVLEVVEVSDGIPLPLPDDRTDRVQTDATQPWSVDDEPTRPIRRVRR